MKQLKVTQCEGEGHGFCKRCSNNGKWERTWMPFLYKIDGMKGCYCLDCVKYIDNQISYIKSLKEPIYHACYIPQYDMWRLYDPRYENNTALYFDSKDYLPDNVIID